MYRHPDVPGSVLILSKDDITAGDGEKHDKFTGKAEAATTTTCNVFRLLNAADVPTAFEKQITSTAFRAFNCTMLPYEVVVRREAHGSHLKRVPTLAKGHVFDPLLVEFFLKTNNRRWKAHELPCDDPLMVLPEKDGLIYLHMPKEPFSRDSRFLGLRQSEVFVNPEGDPFDEMRQIAQHTFFVLERAWAQQGGRLVDFKIEFGFRGDDRNRPLVADVIDNDSWRIILDGYIDKQFYRDGGDLDEVAKKYKAVAEMTSRFPLPH